VDFRYNAITPTASAILAGAYTFPPDFDQATNKILLECAKIRLSILANLILPNIMGKDWSSVWRRAKEGKTSSQSGRHFGHYKAGLRSDHITYLHTLAATLIAKRGIILERWAQGLLVMLERSLDAHLSQSCTPSFSWKLISMPPTKSYTGKECSSKLEKINSSPMKYTANKTDRQTTAHNPRSCSTTSSVKPAGQQVWYRLTQITVTTELRTR
jgi:hypothetical protein